MRRIIFNMIVAVICTCYVFADDGNTISSVQYWIDDNYSAPIINSTMEFDISCAKLSPGMHILNYRVTDDKGRNSVLQQHIFFKSATMPQSTKVASVQYWIDDNYTASITNSNMEFVIDCAELSPGMHILNYRVTDDKGRNSVLQQQSFFKLATIPQSTKVTSLQYWWDDMHNNAVIAPYTADEFMLSTNALPDGLHSLNYRVKDDAGRWSKSRSHYFFKSEKPDSARIVSYSYWWNDLSDKQTTKVLDTPSAAFELEDVFIIPMEARTNFAGHYTAVLNLVVTDNRGRSAFLSTNVVYTDNDAPKTDIDADKYVTSTTVTLSWKELSNDSMGDYNVYYSKDGGPFLLWLPDTKLTSATFKGERGSIYLFTVTGRDASGNREEYDENKCVSVTFE